jgi:transposase-like protein
MKSFVPVHPSVLTTRADFIGRRPLMKWKDLSGQERYRVVEMARKGDAPIGELCRSFGVSRQTLRAAMEKADRASMKALEPKSPGRKGRSPEQAEIISTKKEKASLEKELAQWKQKYEIAMTFVDLQRKALDGEPLPGEEEEPPRKKKKRRRLRKRKVTTTSGPGRTTAEVVGTNDGGGDGSAA